MDQGPILSGNWGENITWDLLATTKTPPADLCTAVMCVAVAGNKIVLARSERGWGMLGGHIEASESLDAALFREAREEGGFIIDQHCLFAVRKITAKQPIAGRQNQAYPFPVSYMAYYWATTTEPLASPTGEEIIESQAFAISEIASLHTPDQPVIELGWKQFALSKASKA